MNKSKNEFPIYKKLFNDKSYYKIVSLKEMDEIQVIGSQIIEQKVLANQYPEQLLILDILDINSKVYISSSEEEYKDRQASNF